MTIATLTQETITVQRTHKFGVLVADDLWYGTKKPISPDDFTVGYTYEVLLEPYTSKAGKTGHNIAQVIGQSESSTVPPVTQSEVDPVGVVSAPTANKIKVAPVKKAIAKAPGKVDSNKGVRDGANAHFASRMTSALLIVGEVSGVEGALKAFKELYHGVDNIVGK